MPHVDIDGIRLAVETWPAGGAVDPDAARRASLVRREVAAVLER